MRRLWHVPWLLCSFVVSILIIRLLDPFAGPDTGIFVAFLLGAMAVSHLMAGLLGFALAKRTWWRAVLVVSVAMIPALLFSIAKGQEAWYLRHQAVYDRFAENLVGPVPASVLSLEFVPLEESHETHLMFRFTISPEDLDRIIRSKGFAEINANQFRRPDDLFTHPEYLPLAEPVTFYIFNDINGGYPDKGIGEGYTLKVSGDRRHVIFRRESAAYYLYRYWESPTERASEEQFLSSLHKNALNTTAQ